jgi:hypothetical protein
VTTPNSDVLYAMSTWTRAGTVRWCSGAAGADGRLRRRLTQHEKADEPGHMGASVTLARPARWASPKLLLRTRSPEWRWLDEQHGVTRTGERRLPEPDLTSIYD